MSNEATFRQHLSELVNILGLIQGDIETGPADKINSWYDDTLEVIFNYEDTVDDIVNPRLNYDEDSLEDEDIIELDEEDEESNITNIEKLDYEISEFDDEINLDSDDINNQYTNTEKNKDKTITININLKSLK